MKVSFFCVLSSAAATAAEKEATNQNPFILTRNFFFRGQRDQLGRQEVPVARLGQRQQVGRDLLQGVGSGLGARRLCRGLEDSRGRVRHGELRDAPFHLFFFCFFWLKGSQSRSCSVVRWSSRGVEESEREKQGRAAGVDDRTAKRRQERNKSSNLTLASTSSAILVFSVAGTSWRRMRSHDAVISC